MSEEVLKFLRKKIREKSAGRIISVSPAGRNGEFYHEQGGKKSCRAFTFMRNTVFKVKKSRLMNRELIDYWFKEGLRLFNKKDNFIVLEEDDQYIYIFLDYATNRFSPSVCQWFLFPGYTYFTRFVAKYRAIRENSKLRQDQAAKLTYYLISEKRTSSTDEFGHKFPFVTDSLGRPMISGAYFSKLAHTKMFENDHCQIVIPSITVRGLNDAFGLGYCLIPRTSFDKKMSYEKMYARTLKEQVLYLKLFKKITAKDKWPNDSTLVTMSSRPGMSKSAEDVIELLDKALNKEEVAFVFGGARRCLMDIFKIETEIEAEKIKTNNERLESLIDYLEKEIHECNGVE